MASPPAIRRYTPLFEYFTAEHKSAFRVVADDYVSAEDGTGIVHQAPAFGEDDMRVCLAAGITAVRRQRGWRWLPRGLRLRPCFPTAHSTL